ncbi:hypothetical protein PUNSTDRAFT_139369 [Punctularia strigosozonata HHB-11173 SS5]|uniref:Uncharacterized protein n=1 Tax=Punctularia strigosozonata (strain HHB-11173) TaxID=741275 RepID=R7S1D4_PUNST|nr:uncharacterized protein PUNSTDRAFT_139369 [Punctularia strigosozonata HHB-11173 SS5]EIN03654.1 hypothetical protein PUNSTDRAFT_139369 [Punctularia strigosozonata HHB-11173 SS5]
MRPGRSNPRRSIDEDLMISEWQDRCNIDWAEHDTSAQLTMRAALPDGMQSASGLDTSMLKDIPMVGSPDAPLATIRVNFQGSEAASREPRRFELSGDMPLGGLCLKGNFHTAHKATSSAVALIQRPRHRLDDHSP